MYVSELRGMTIRLLLLILLLPAMANAGWLKPARMDLNGQQRNYSLFSPVAKPQALLMVLHGGHGDGKGVARYTNFRELAKQYALLLVYPDALQGHWNDARSATGNGQNDVIFITRLAARLGEQYAIPLERRFLVGLSNGGFMSWRVACESPQSFSAISPVIATLPVNQASHCEAAQSINLLAIMGNADPIVPWSGGSVKKGRSSGKGGQVMSGLKTFEFWRSQYACSDQTEQTMLEDKDPDDESRAILWQAKGCRNQVKLELLELDNVGHNWPGRKHGWLMRRITGNVNQDIDARLFLLDFFGLKPVTE